MTTCRSISVWVHRSCSSALSPSTTVFAAPMLSSSSSRVPPSQRRTMITSLEEALDLLSIHNNNNRRKMVQDSTGDRTNLFLQAPKMVEATMPSPKKIRAAYFLAAKKCHPDVQQGKEEDDALNSHDAAQLFLRITEAYEFLLSRSSWTEDDALFGSSTSSSKDEEEEYREACDNWLGINAEVVEESKRCPLFRQWLLGRSESAKRWQMFLCLNGGLAPRLRRRQNDPASPGPWRLLGSSSSGAPDTDPTSEDGGSPYDPSRTDGVKLSRRRKKR